MQAQTTAGDRGLVGGLEARIGVLVKQCAWCGQIENGPQAGTTPRTANGRPELLRGATHGICDICAAQVRRRYLAERIRRHLGGAVRH